MSALPKTNRSEEQVLLDGIKAGFIRQGSSFHAWCWKQSPPVNQANARIAILGAWRGPKAKRLVARIKLAAGLE